MPPESPSPAPQPPKFYLTTPIYYVNARPHIGHAYTTIVADVLARRHRLLGEETFFLTGTDEHGQKIERSAAAAGIPPQQFADEVSAQFRTLWDRMGLTYNRYIRTTDPEHKRGVQQLFRTLYERGFIYLSTYTGSYCVSDEAFVDQPAGTPCPDCGRPLETVTEENFFFKLSAFQKPLLDLIESNQLLITPDTARNEVLSFVRGGLKDLSISRSSFTWGIPVPADVQQASGTTQNHVIYVWLDALANYITAIGYGTDTPEAQAEFQKFWPADLHLVGKEITRFHCVYWPAFLLAAGLPLPKQITANGWLLFDNAKMSKSRGNVVRTETILDAFGDEVYGKQFPESTKAERDLFASDVLRYFLLREIPFGQDGSFSFDALVTRYNADLANGYGNLVSRVVNMLQQYCKGTVPDGYAYTSPDSRSFASSQEVLSCNLSELEQLIARNQWHFALELIFAEIRGIDRYISEQAPWKLAKTGPGDLLNFILCSTAENIRILTLLLHPILPYTTAKVWQQLGLNEFPRTTNNEQRTTSLTWGGLQPGTKLGPLAPIFPAPPRSLPKRWPTWKTTATNPPRCTNSSSSRKPPASPWSPKPACPRPRPPKPRTPTPGHPATPAPARAPARWTGPPVRCRSAAATPLAPRCPPPPAPAARPRPAASSTTPPRRLRPRPQTLTARKPSPSTTSSRSSCASPRS